MKKNKLGSALLLCTLAASMVGGTSITTFAADSETASSSSAGFETQKNYLGVTITKYTGSDKVVKVPDTINGDKVVYIGENAFNNCQGIQEVTLPKSLNGIGNGAFSSCTNLEKITMPESLTSMGYCVFKDCLKLTEIVVPDGVTDLGMDFASGCSSLTKVTLPDSLETIRSGAFSGCTSLRSIEIPSTTTRIEAPFQDLKQIVIVGEKGSKAEEYAKAANFEFKVSGSADIENKQQSSDDYEYIANSKEVEITAYKGDKENITIPDEIDGLKVTSIGTGAFSGNETIKEIKIPDTVQIINKDAFKGCISLESINIPDGLTKIKENAFMGCKSLDNITLNDNLEAISYNAFDGCNSLSKINIPESVILIEKNAFDNCKKLAAINVSEDNSQYMSRDGLLYSKVQTYKNDQGNTTSFTNLIKCPDGYKDSSVKIDDDVNYITFGAFSGASNVETLVFGDMEINIKEVKDVIVEKIKSQGDDVEISDVQLSIDTLEKVSEASKSSDSDFDLSFTGGLMDVTINDKILPGKTDIDPNKENDDADIASGKKAEDENKSEGKIEDENKSEDKASKNTADFSNALGLMGLASAAYGVMRKIKSIKR